MIDRNKVIEQLESMRDYHRSIGDNITADIANDAIAMLKEQKPVEPVQRLVYTTKGWFCGACDGRLNRLGKYCSFCGRPVKWDEI